MIAAAMLAASLTAAKSFAGLTLDNALQKAVAISPDVAQARERVTENQSLLAAARGLAAPQLTANYNQAPQAGNDNNTLTQRLYTFGGQITLGDYLASSPAVRQAAFTLSAAQFDLLDAQRAERVKLVGQYYTALKAAATLDLRSQDLAGARSDLRAAELRFRAGDSPKLDVVRAQVALANAQAALGAAQVDLTNAQDALSIETGVSQQDLSRIENVPSSVPGVSDPQRAVTRALATRSDLASAHQAVQAEEAAVRAAERAIFPAVTVAAGYTTGTDTGIPVHGPSATVNLALPVSHAAADRVAAERARLAQAQSKEEAVRRQIRVDVAAAARSYQESARATEAATRARQAAQEELHATQTGYRNGASSSLDVADARRTYVQAALSELSAVYAQAQAAATLEQEVGP